MRTIRAFIVLASGCLSITAATAAGQMAPPPETSSLLANPRLSPEARQAIQDRVDAVHARFRASHGGLGPEQFGVQCCHITQIHAAAFSPSYGPNWLYASGGYMYPAVAQSSLWASVQLPSGVEIQYFDLYYFDSNASYDLDAALFGLSGGGVTSGTPALSLLGSASSSGNSGYGYDGGEVTHTVNNNVAYDPAAAQLVVSVGTTVNGGGGVNLQFKAVDLWWMRQVAPSPAAATFGDVPTNHPFFQFVEALAASGITGGCGGNPPLYCVDAPLTRGQMAVFLSKALGLYWPY